MAPSAISMDPVSRLEAESTLIIEAAQTDVKSNPYYEVKPHLVPITTEVPVESSSGPSSTTDGFIDTPETSHTPVEPSSVPEDSTHVEVPIVAPAAVESTSEPQQFTDAPRPAVTSVESTPIIDSVADAKPSEPAAVETSTAVEETSTIVAEDSPVVEETSPVAEETSPVFEETSPVVVEASTAVVEELKETSQAGLAVKELPSATDATKNTPAVKVAVKEIPPPQPKWLTLNEVIPSVQEPMSGAKKLRKMIFETKELIICPGVYDGLSARTAIEVGFNAMYMTGAGTTASRLGQPDLAIAQLHEMRENAEMIAGLDPFGPPLIADMDTGYGGPIMAARTVEQYIRAGVAGAHLEDQVLMKRCGHLGGKRVVPADEYIARIRAAHAARVRMQSDFVLIARTDALQQLGYDECIKRLRMARDEGADVGLLEGFSSKEQAAQAVQDLAPWPLLLNSVENGKSPLITVDEARKMGFRIMIFSFATIAPAYVAIRETLIRLRDQGVVGTPPDISPLKIFDVCGLKHSMAVDMNAGGASFGEEL